MVVRILSDSCRTAVGRRDTGSPGHWDTGASGFEKKHKKQSVSQTIDLVMTIQTVQESSKSELSSRFLSTSKFLADQSFGRSEGGGSKDPLARSKYLKI